MGYTPNTSIIILTFNNLNNTKDCIDSIRKYTENGTYEIVVVDNGSTDDTRSWLAEQEDIVTILNSENYGFPKGCNIGIEAAQIENDILLLNNDTIVTPRWLENMKEALYSDDKIAAVGPVSNCVANEQQIDITFNNKEEIISFAENYNKLNKEKWEEKHLLIGYCFYVKRAILEEIGYLDELFSPGNYEDCDLSLRIIQNGYKLILCNDTFIYHEGSATFRANPNIYSFFGQNREKFNNKWGFDHSLISDVKIDQLSLLNLSRDVPVNILEIGCGSGMNLLKIKYWCPKANLYGIEPTPKIDKIARRLVTLSTKKVEDYPIDFNENFFDYILINDYLNLVEDPDRFIKELYKLLKEDGHIVCNLDNLLSIRNVYELLNGNFYSKLEEKKFRNHFTFKDVVDLFRKNNMGLLNGQGHGEALEQQHINLIEAIKNTGVVSDDMHLKVYKYSLDFIK